MNICIIGGGNIGTYMAAYIASKAKYNVSLYTPKKNRFSSSIELKKEEVNVTEYVQIDHITDNLKEAVEKANIIFITLPSFMRKNIIDKITKYITKGTFIGCIPGFGGSEFCIKGLLEKGCTFFGSQRVPAIARLNEYGKSVSLKEKNKFIKVSAIPLNKTQQIATVIEELLDIKCIILPNYLPITLSPSNPIMHPARLIEIFYDEVKKCEISHKKEVLFYQDWNNRASENLLALDEELGKIFEVLQMSQEGRETIKGRFNISNSTELTQKIRYAYGFRGIKAPMIKKGDLYVADSSSRYFTEDIPYGLCIIKSFAEICKIDTPVTDHILSWGQKILNKEYLVNGRLCGKDIEELLIPQQIGINDKEVLSAYYES